FFFLSSCYVSGKEVSGNQFVDALDSAVRRARADVKNHRILIKDAVVFLQEVIVFQGKKSLLLAAPAIPNILCNHPFSSLLYTDILPAPCCSSFLFFLHL